MQVPDRSIQGKLQIPLWPIHNYLYSVKLRMLKQKTKLFINLKQKNSETFEHSGKIESLGYRLFSDK